MSGLPVVLRLEGRRCLVVGGGTVAARKAAALVRAGGRVLVVASRIRARLERRSGVECRKRPFRSSDLAGAALCVAATDNARVQRRVYALCVARGIPVNVVDVPELCTFTMPAVVRRGGISIAVSTGGRAPGGSRRRRARLARAVPPAFGGFLRLLEKARANLPKGISYRARQVLFRRISSDSIFRLYARKGAAAADARILRILRSRAPRGVMLMSAAIAPWKSPARD